MNRSQSKNHKIGTYKINKISLSSFDDKICIINNEYDGLALGWLLQLILRKQQNNFFD